MNKQQRYTEEFKQAAVQQVTKCQFCAAEVAERLAFQATARISDLARLKTNKSTPALTLFAVSVA